MSPDSVDAYDLPECVVAYDADMDIMHPLRSRMVEVILDVLPFRSADALTAIDLGVGTGILTERFLRRFPSSTVTAVDGATSMVQLATSRLGELARRVTFVVADFRELPADLAETGSVDVVFSSYALHHLSYDEKRQVIRTALSFLRPGGWFLNADLVLAASEEVEKRIQQLRVDGVVRRAPDGDARFRDARSTRAFLDELEANEKDQALTLAADLEVARDAGLVRAELLWREYREVVIGGPK